MERAWIISIGTELALGQTVDTNGACLARGLAELGIRTERHVTVPDELQAIRAALCQAADACDLIITTGGLGPTDDDLTREALAQAAGVELVLDPASVERIRAFFAAREREMPERNKVQARLPRTARMLPNTCGTAPGIAMELSGTPCYVLPGVPFEMRTMFEQQVAPRLQATSARCVLVSRELLCFGQGEADIGARLSDLMVRGRNPEVGTTAELGVIGIRMNAAADTPQAAEALLSETEREIRSRLGEVVFGREGDTLAAVVGELLVKRGETLCTAESCTGGLIGKYLTDVPGSSRYFLGGVVSYSNEAKQRLLGIAAEQLAAHGAVSEPVARAMAVGARTRFAGDYALAVTGIAGPTGGTQEKPVGFVYIAVAGPEEVQAQEFRFGSDAPREVIRERAARTALNLLRLKLLAREQGGASGVGPGRGLRG